MNTDQKIQIFLGVAQVLATLLIAYIVYRQTEKVKRIELTKQAIDAYNVLNLAAVSSDANLIAFDKMGRQDTEEDIEIRRKRWCAFVWLEALQVTYLSLKHNLIDRAYAEQALQQQLQVILNDEDVYWLVCNRGFDPGFAEYCTVIRKRLGVSQSEKQGKTEISQPKVEVTRQTAPNNSFNPTAR